MATKNSASGGAYAPEARQRISKLGPESLPDNPSGKGLTARQIKSALAWGLYYLFDLAARKEEENASELSGKVPYAGASGDLDMGNFGISASSLEASLGGNSAKLTHSGIEISKGGAEAIVLSWPEEAGRIALKADEEALAARVASLEGGLEGAEEDVSFLQSLFDGGAAKTALADGEGNPIAETYATKATLAIAEAAIGALEALFSGGKAKEALVAERAAADADGNPISATYMRQSAAGTQVATLSGGKVPSSQLPSYVDDVLEYGSSSSFPAQGESGKIYVDTSSNRQYRWSGTQYVEISKSLALGETSSTAFPGDRGKELEAKAGRLEAEASAMQAGIDALESGKQDELEAPTASEIQQWWDEAEE